MIITLLAMRFMAFPWWMPMMADVSAEKQDPMISGNWLVNALVILIPVIASAFVVVVGKNHWKAQGNKEAQKRTTTIEGQPLGVKLEEQPDPPATKKELSALEERITRELKKIEEALGKERDIARVANGNLHARADKSVEVMAEMKGELKQISENVDRLLDLAMKRPTR